MNIKQLLIQAIYLYSASFLLVIGIAKINGAHGVFIYLGIVLIVAAIIHAYDCIGGKNHETNQRRD